MTRRQFIKGKKDGCEEALKANAIVEKRKEIDRVATASRAVPNSCPWLY